MQNAKQLTVFSYLKILRSKTVVATSVLAVYGTVLAVYRSVLAVYSVRTSLIQHCISLIQHCISCISELLHYIVDTVGKILAKNCKTLFFFCLITVGISLCSSKWISGLRSHTLLAENRPHPHNQEEEKFCLFHIRFDLFQFLQDPFQIVVEVVVAADAEVVADTAAVGRDGLVVRDAVELEQLL